MIKVLLDNYVIRQRALEPYDQRKSFYKKLLPNNIKLTDDYQRWQDDTSNSYTNIRIYSYNQTPGVIIAANGYVYIKKNGTAFEEQKLQDVDLYLINSLTIASQYTILVDHVIPIKTQEQMLTIQNNKLLLRRGGYINLRLPATRQLIIHYVLEQTNRCS